MAKAPRRLIIISLSSLLLLSQVIWGQQREVTMTLEECIVDAVKHNLDVKVQVFAPQIQEMAIRRANERFLPQLDFGYNLQSQESASYSFLDTDETLLTDYNDWSARLSQELPTGGQLSVNLVSYKNDSNQSYQLINPRYGSTLSFRFEQPLLRNFGFKVSRRDVIIAKNNLGVSENQFKGTLLNTVYSVEEAYWNLVFSIENLEVLQHSLDLARDLLRKNKKEVEVGTLAPLEILTAQAEVATREADILQAQVAVENQNDILKTLINSFSEAENQLIYVNPSERPGIKELDIDVDQALKTALLNRPDLEASRHTLKNRELDLSIARNQLLPDLSLTANYWSPGISGTQLLYQDNNPLGGVVIGNIPGTSTDSLRDAMNFKYRNWAVELTLTIPTNLIFSRAQEAQARLTLEQSLADIQNQEKQIFLEVRSAIRTVKTNHKRVEAYRVARELAEESLAAEEKKLRVGMTTNYTVLQYQRDLANARSAELRAVLDYTLSLASLDRAMGVTLDKKNISLTY